MVALQLQTMSQSSGGGAGSPVPDALPLSQSSIASVETDIFGENRLPDELPLDNLPAEHAAELVVDPPEQLPPDVGTVPTPPPSSKPIRLADEAPTRVPRAAGRRKNVSDFSLVDVRVAPVAASSSASRDPGPTHMASSTLGCTPSGPMAWYANPPTPAQARNLARLDNKSDHDLGLPIIIQAFAKRPSDLDVLVPATVASRNPDGSPTANQVRKVCDFFLGGLPRQMCTIESMATSLDIDRKRLPLLIRRVACATYMLMHALLQD